MGQLRARLLGPPSIDVDGRPLAVDTRKATALVALLAVAGEPQPRRSLASMLWPESDDQHASGALRRTLSVLRTALGGRWVELRDSSVALEGSGLETDVEHERRDWAELARHRDHGAAVEPVASCPECVRALESIVGLHRGPFMAGFSLRDSPEFEDWQATTARAFERHLVDALERLTSAYEADGRFGDALRTAERWLTIDPLNERAHRELITIHASAGDRPGAIRCYRQCVRILDEELSVEPLPETTELYRRVVMGDPTVGAAGQRRGGEQRGPRPATGQASDTARRQVSERRQPLPLVGRGEELARLVGAWREAGRGGGFAIVEGEPGIGRTRMAEELSDTASAARSAVVAIACFREDRGFPYAATLELLRVLAARRPDRAESLPPHVRREIGRLAPELVSGREPPAPSRGSPRFDVATPVDGAESTDVAQARFVEALVAAVIGLGAPEPGSPPSLIVVDDAQWIDRPTAQLLVRLRRRIGTSAILVLLLRSGVDEGGGLLDPLLEPGPARATIVPLSRLRRDDVAELALELGLPELRGPELFAASEGVPFYLAEHLAAQPSPDATARRPVPPDPVAPRRISPELPDGVRSLVEARFRGLTEQARQVLGAAAVIGRSFDPDLVREVSGRGADETIEALEELTIAGLVRERPGSSDDDAVYDFDHSRTVDAAYAQLGLARRRLLHARAAEALRASPGSDAAVATAIARHYQAAGRDEDAARFLVDAAGDAERVFANAESLALYRAAMALQPGLSRLLLERTAHLAVLLGRHDEAIRDLETALATVSTWATREADAPAIARLEHRLGAVHARRGDWALAERHLAAALDLLPPGARADRSRVVLDQAIVARWRGDLSTATELAEVALTAAEASGDASVAAEAYNVRGMLARLAGDLDQARHLLGRSLDLATSAGALAARVAALNNLALVESGRGEIEAATELTREALRLCARIGDRQREAALHSNLGDLLHAAGRAEEARRHVRESVAMLAELGVPGELNPEVWRLVEW